MSKRSKKHLSRSQIRRRKQLNDRNDRIGTRENESNLQEEFAPEPFLQKHIIKLLMAALLVIGFLVIRTFFIPLEMETGHSRESVTSDLLDRSFEWELKYPYGYKIIALTDENIIQTSYDTLPKELKINWKKISIARIEANQLANTIEKIKIVLTDINYAPENVTGLSVTSSISRYKGAKSLLSRFGNLNFMFEIVEDSGEKVFCLLGLQDN